VPVRTWDARQRREFEEIQKNPPLTPEQIYWNREHDRILREMDQAKADEQADRERHARKIKDREVRERAEAERADKRAAFLVAEASRHALYQQYELTSAERSQVTRRLFSEGRLADIERTTILILEVLARRQNA
jgi:hypothetical protein